MAFRGPPSRPKTYLRVDQFKGLRPLRAWFNHDPVRWHEFLRSYRDELDHNPAPLAELRQLMQEGQVTLLYAAHDEEHNNAVALLSFLEGKGV